MSAEAGLGEVSELRRVENMSLASKLLLGWSTEKVSETITAKIGRLKKARRLNLDPRDINSVECPDCGLTFDSEIELEIHGFIAHERHWLRGKPRRSIEIVVA